MGRALSKAKAEVAHARRRAQERYGLEVGRATRDEIRSTIRGGRARLVRRQSLRVGVFDVPLADGFTVRVVWDRTRGTIVTFLPRPSDG